MPIYGIFIFTVLIIIIIIFSKEKIWAYKDASTTNICPLANKASRQAAVAGWKQIPSLAEKHGVKVLSFDHFDPEHFIIAMFEADNIEAVRDFAMEAGLMAWNNLKINPVTPVSELMDNMDKAPPTIF